MDNLNKARNYDLYDDPNEALNFYLRAVEDETAELSDYINASVIAFLCQDYGYSSDKKLPQKLIDMAWSEMFALLDKAEVKFGKNPNLSFWKNYFGVILLGKRGIKKECRDYLSQGVLDAAICLMDESNKVNLVNQALEELNARAERGGCIKDRYIQSVIQGNVKRRTYSKIKEKSKRKKSQKIQSKGQSN
ncbi:hypothetical protein [Aurantivibrio infirmus]